MPKRRGRKAVEKAPSKATEQEETPLPENENSFQDQEVERQSAAIRALRDVEIERLKTMVRLMRSYNTKEQLQVPVLEYFKENHPNLCIVKNEKNKDYEVKWKDSDGDGNLVANERNIHSTLLHRLSMVYPDYSAPINSFGGYEFSNKTVKSSMFGVENLQIRGFTLDEPSENQPFELQDSLQTPGVSNQRLSVGMTPNTVRLPKPGEMLLSIHGSPLGVFKEDNMEAIQESEDG